MRRSSWWRLALPVVALAAVVVWLLVVTLTGGEPEQAASGGTRTGPASAQPTSRPPQSTAAPGRTSAAPSQTSAAPTGDSAGAIPAGFVRFRDPTGFTVVLPRGWQPVRNDPRVDFREPGGGRFLRIDQTTEPAGDPYLDWVRQEGTVSRRLAGYDRIRLERVDYRGWSAADWEFTTASGSGRTHVLNRNVVTGPRAYALYWSTPDSQWSDPDSRQIFETAARTFTPAG